MSDFTVPGGAISSRDDADIPAALRTPTQTLGIGFLALFSLSILVIWMGIFPTLQILLPIQITILDAAHKVSDYSLISVLGALTSLITFPLAGALSDRTTARLGRRRPWIIGGVIGAAAMLAFLANAPSLVALALGWIFFTICINCAQAAMFTLIADKVPPQQRATVSAFTGISAPIGIALGSVLVGRVLKTPQAGYYTLAALIFVVVLLFTLILREEPLARGVMPPLRLRSFLAGFWINPAKHADFGWAWLTRFLLILSYACGTGFLLFFLQDAIHYEQIFHGQRAAQGVSTFQLILTLFLLIAGISSGLLSDRLQRRKVFVMIAGVLMAIALLLLAFFPSWTMVELAAGVFGLGYGIYIAVDLALMIHVLPSAKNRGKDMGVVNIAGTLPQVIAPVLLGLLIAHFHSYLLPFLLAAIFSLLASALIPRIKSVQ